MLLKSSLETSLLLIKWRRSLYVLRRPGEIVRLWSPQAFGGNKRFKHAKNRQSSEPYTKITLPKWRVWTMNSILNSTDFTPLNWRDCFDIWNNWNWNPNRWRRRQLWWTRFVTLLYGWIHWGVVLNGFHCRALYVDGSRNLGNLVRVLRVGQIEGTPALISYNN